MTTSFDGMAFTQLAPLGAMTAVEQTIEADVSVRHIPGGTVNYIDIGGPRPRELTINTKFSSEAEWLDFKSKVGVSATLSLSLGDVTAVLMRANAQRQLDPNGSPFRQGQATFILIES